MIRSIGRDRRVGYGRRCLAVRDAVLCLLRPIDVVMRAGLSCLSALVQRKQASYLGGHTDGRSQCL